MKNIFVIITEHHVAMALAIIRQEKLKNNVILFSSQTRNICNENFFREIESSDLYSDTEFFSVDDQVPSKFIFYKPLWRKVYFKRVYKKVLNYLKNFGKSKRFFIFADQDPVTQFIISQFPGYEFHLAQDGFAQYTKHELTKRSAEHKQGYYKWMFGDFWKPIRHFGDYHEYSSLYVLYPELVEDRYKKLDLKKVDLDQFYSSTWQEFSRRFVLKEFPQFFYLNKADAIVFLPRLKNKKEVWFVKQQLSQLCKQENIKRLCLKNHPRSSVKLHKVGFIESFSVPGSLPAECLFAFNTEVHVRYYVPLSTLVIVGPYNAQQDQIHILFGNQLASTNLEFQDNKPLYSFLKANTVLHDE